MKGCLFMCDGTEIDDEDGFHVIHQMPDDHMIFVPEGEEFHGCK